MGILANAKHERFAQALAKGRTADEAYEAAGYSANRGNATRLNAKESVRKRVHELQSRAADALNVSQQWLMERAEEARKGAMEAGQHAAAVSAIKELGILSGHRVEKRENTHRTLNDMSDDELARIATGGGNGDFTPALGSSLSH